MAKHLKNHFAIFSFFEFELYCHDVRAKMLEQTQLHCKRKLFLLLIDRKIFLQCVALILTRLTWNFNFNRYILYDTHFYSVYLWFWTSLTWQFDYTLQLIFDNAPAASDNTVHFRSGQKWPENNYFSYITKLKFNPRFTLYKSVS